MHMRVRYNIVYCHPFLPEHHHVHGVMSEAGDQRRQRDDKDDGEQQMRAAVGAGRWTGLILAPRYTPAVCIQLYPERTRRTY